MTDDQGRPDAGGPGRGHYNIRIGENTFVDCGEMADGQMRVTRTDDGTITITRLAANDITYAWTADANHVQMIAPINPRVEYNLGRNYAYRTTQYPRAEFRECTQAERTESAEQRRRTLERIEAQERAEARAAELLRRLLNDAQRTEYDRWRYFTLTGSAGTRFRVRYGMTGNIDVLRPDGRAGGVLCGYPNTVVHDAGGAHVGYLPVSDVIVGQLLVLRGDEPEFWRRANIYIEHGYLAQRRAEVLGPVGRAGDPPREDNLFTRIFLANPY